MSTTDETNAVYPQCFTTVDGYTFRLPSQTEQLATGGWIKTECLIKKEGAGGNPFLVDLNASGSGSFADPSRNTQRQHAEVNDCLELLKSLSLKFDKITQSVVPGTQEDNNEFSQLFPIATKERLDYLEAKLAGSSFANRFVDHLIDYHGQTSDKMDMTKLMYYFLDFMFTKDFMNTCSWTGVSKGQVVKHEFRKHPNFVKQLDRVIKLVISNHNITETRELIQKALNASGQRLKSERAKAVRRDSTL